MFVLLVLVLFELVSLAILLDEECGGDSWR